MFHDEPGNPKITTGPLSAPQNAPLDDPYLFALTQDYGGPQGVCHLYLTTVSPDDPSGDWNGYGNNSGTFVVVNDSGLQPVTYALTATTTSISSTSTPTMGTLSTFITVTASSTPARDNGIKASSSQGLSSGTKAGVAVGVVCGVLSVAILSWLLFRKRRQHTKQVVEVTEHLSDTHQHLSHDAEELPGMEVAAELALTSRYIELDGVPLAEAE